MKMYNMMFKAKCIVDYIGFTKTIRGVAKKYGVSKSTVHRWIQMDKRSNGILQKRKQYKKRMHKRKDDIVLCIRNAITSRPFISMDDLATLLNQEHKVKLSGRTMNRYVTAEGYTYKKAVTCVNHHHDNNLVASFCKRFEDTYKSNTLYCIDEAGFYVGDHPRKGRAQKGTRLAIGQGKIIKKTKFTLIMLIGAKGIIGYEILDHNCKKDDFINFMSNIVLPSGSTILMDNLRAHHSKEVKAVADNKGFNILFTPPYSPRCNPIEKIFGMLKPSYRKHCTNLETHQAEDFKNLFIAVIASYQNMSFNPTYMNTFVFTQDSANKIKEDPDFKFIGYDVSTFITLYTDLQ